MATIPDEIKDNAPPTGLRFEDGTEFAKFVGVLWFAFETLQADVTQAQKDRYVESATGTALNYLGEEYGVRRPAGEGDDKFRIRVWAGLGASTSETTWDDFANLAMQLLQAGPDNVRLVVDYTDELGAVITKISTRDIDKSPFTESEIANFLERSIPGSRRVVIRYLNGFQFSDPATVGSKLGRGWGQGVWTT